MAAKIRLKVEWRSLYGIARAFIVENDQQAGALRWLTGKKSFTTADLEAIEVLGFEVIESESAGVRAR